MAKTSGFVTLVESSTRATVWTEDKKNSVAGSTDGLARKKGRKKPRPFFGVFDFPLCRLAVIFKESWVNMSLAPSAQKRLSDQA
jgi:hypothetical protein